MIKNVAPCAGNDGGLEYILPLQFKCMHPITFNAGNAQWSDFSAPQSVLM